MAKNENGIKDFGFGGKLHCTWAEDCLLEMAHEGEHVFKCLSKDPSSPRRCDLPEGHEGLHHDSTFNEEYEYRADLPPATSKCSAAIETDGARKSNELDGK